MRRPYRHTIATLAGWLVLTGLSILAMWLVATLALSHLEHERLPTVLASKLSADYSAGTVSLAPLDPMILDAINRDRRPPALTSATGPALVPIFIAGRGNEAPAGPTGTATGVPSVTPAATTAGPASPTAAAPPMVPAAPRTPRSVTTPQGSGGPPSTPAIGGGERIATSTPAPVATPAPALTPPGAGATPPPPPQPSPGVGAPPGHGRP